MTVRDLRLFGDPVLRQRAAEVVDFDRELRQLVTDLTETMVDAEGSGIAAPQIGVGLRVFTYVVDDVFGHVVNPVLEVVGEEEQEESEGCLSLPGLRFDCRRHLTVVTTGFTMHGEPLRIEGTGRLSVVVEHETDHLDGVLFVDRLDPATRGDVEAAIREAEWSGGVVPEIRASPHAPLRPTSAAAHPPAHPSPPPLS